MKTIHGNILDIEKGTIIQQVNCRNAYGRGISGQISDRWPNVLKDYRDSFTKQSAQELYKSFRAIPVSDKITVINSYTQFNYGNSTRTGINYTDMPALINVIKQVCSQYDNVYIPYRIGCGLAGGNWDQLTEAIKNLPVTIVKYDEIPIIDMGKSKDNTYDQPK